MQSNEDKKKILSDAYMMILEKPGHLKEIAGRVNEELADIADNPVLYVSVIGLAVDQWEADCGMDPETVQALMERLPAARQRVRQELGALEPKKPKII